MLPRKAGYFVLEGINAFACGFYGNYLFFLLRDQHHFGNRENLAVSALQGLIYVVAAWQCGRFAERRGFTTSLRVGFAGMALVLSAGSFATSVPMKLLTLVLWTTTMMFTWPALEALICERETPRGLQRMVGIYNCVWSGSSAVAYFLGGALFERLGTKSIFLLPAGLHGMQLLLLAWLERNTPPPEPPAEPAPAAPHAPEAAAYQQPVSPRAFLNMAWLANPFAYIAINTVLAVIPQLAARLQLTTTQSGLFCSLWFFARLGAFFALWHWTGWHYRFRWLLAAFCGLIAGFSTLLLADRLWLLVLAQLLFGLSTGLIYYSSLFYSMDVGETKGEHGGLHEAAIGAGICVGPAVGAAALQFAPGRANAGTLAVAALLTAGLAGLVFLRLKSGARREN